MTLRAKLIGQASLCLVKASREPDRRQYWIDQTINCLEKAAGAEAETASAPRGRQRPSAA
jgi:hypothetical protein